MVTEVKEGDSGAHKRSIIYFAIFSVLLILLFGIPVIPLIIGIYFAVIVVLLKPISKTVVSIKEKMGNSKMLFFLFEFFVYFVLTAILLFIYAVIFGS